jgi:hypothetical protein
MCEMSFFILCFYLEKEENECVRGVFFILCLFLEEEENECVKGVFLSSVFLWKRRRMSV